MKSVFLTSCGVIGSVLAGALGGFDQAIITLLIFMGIDFVTGLVVGGVFHKSNKTATGSLESRAGWKGLIRKGCTLLIVVIANRLDMQMGTSYIRDAVCISFMVNELLSIIENAGLMGVPIPKIITRAIEILKEKENETDAD